MTSAVESLAERLVSSAAAMTDLMAIAVGDRLGFYRALADRGPLDAGGLASATGTAARYAREWLEQQAVTGLLVVAEDGEPESRRFALAPGVEQVLASPDDVYCLAPLARQLVAAAAHLPDVVDGARTGAGVPWSEFGADMRESEGDLNRPAYLQLLASQWMRALPDVLARLQNAGARIADVGSGVGWSAIGLARGFTAASIDAFEIDPASVDSARRNVDAAGLAGRVRVHQMDVGDAEVELPYDLVTAFECVHDMPYPVPALAAMRAMAGATGAVLIADMKAADAFAAPGDVIERLLYGFSVSVCLPDSMSSERSMATGTVMRPDTMRSYAEQAGFADVQTLPIEHDIWRFYRLIP